MFILYTQKSESKDVEILRIGSKEDCVKAAYEHFDNITGYERLPLKEIEQDLDNNELSDFNGIEYEVYKLREV